MNNHEYQQTNTSNRISVKTTTNNNTNNSDYFYCWKEISNYEIMFLLVSQMMMTCFSLRSTVINVAEDQNSIRINLHPDMDNNSDYYFTTAIISFI